MSEYDFSNEVEPEDEDTDEVMGTYEDDVADKAGTDDNPLVIPSDDEEKPIEAFMRLQAAHRPWKSFNRAARLEWERMYARIQDIVVDNDIDYTEDYQRLKDVEMLE